MGDCALPCPLRRGDADPADIRILRRVDLRTGATGLGDPDGPYVAAVVDCETTGLSPDDDVIIELGLRRFHYDDRGVITYVGKPYSWLEDPGYSLPPEVTRLTGLTDADVAGRSLDEDRIDELMLGATIRIAHNARFDRAFVERQLPLTAGATWACSCEEVPWRERGFDGAARNLGWLLMQTGSWHDGHRAIADVDAVIALMGHRFADGAMALSLLLRSSAARGWIVRADGAPFHKKERLKGRGYRWSPTERVWAKEIGQLDRVDEEAWLASNVYPTTARPGAAQPVFAEVTARTRYA